MTLIPEMESDEAQVYIVRCSVCHALPHPKRHAYTQWTHIIEWMNELMEKRNLKKLNKDDKATILNFLKKNAR